MDGMLVLGMMFAAMALAVLLMLHLRRRYGSGSDGSDGIGGGGGDGGHSHHDGCDGGGDGGGGD